MSTQLISAINNHDADALARMANGGSAPQKVLDAEAEKLVDALFRQLKQIFPASTQTNLRTDAEEKTAKRQWIAAFAENGIRSREQLSAGVRHARASESPFWPSPGQFIRWCKDCSTVLGVTLEETMEEFKRYNRDAGLHFGGPEKFPWKKPIFYWVVCEARRQMYQKQLSESEVEKVVGKKLQEWAEKVSSGELIPNPIARIESRNEVIQTCHNQPKDSAELRYMPNAAYLGSVTPAQWLHEEYLRRKATGRLI